MKEFHYKFYSPNLNTETEVLVYGDSGYPVITFPTSMGKYFQNRDFKLIESVSDLVDEGRIKIYCVDGEDEMTWYNKVISPAERVKNHVWYDRFVREEVIPMALNDTGYNKVCVAGCSFGGYHAANVAFRYPEVVGYLIAMGAGFDIKNQLDGFYDDSVYYNNPPDFLSGLEHPDLWKMGIILGTGTEDFCLPQNESLSRILEEKNVPHWLDVRPGGIHDWPVWRQMFPDYLREMLKTV